MNQNPKATIVPDVRLTESPIIAHKPRGLARSES